MGSIGMPEIFTLLVILVLILGPIRLASCFNKRLHVKQPNARPFKWGYWLGLGCFLAPFYMLAQTGGSIMVFIIAALIYFPVGVFVLLRHRWALVAITILSFNPIIWIANIFYIMNRWIEMKASKTTQPYTSNVWEGNAPISSVIEPNVQDIQLNQDIVVSP